MDNGTMESNNNNNVLFQTKDEHDVLSDSSDSIEFIYAISDSDDNSNNDDYNVTQEIDSSSCETIDENYEAKGARLNSFLRADFFEKYIKISVHKLAAAGFYYTMGNDYVTCFSCKGILTSQNFTRQPWDEHAYWYPKCEFVLQQKGQMFVDKFVKQREEEQWQEEDEEEEQMLEIAEND